jgi:hypothetical protein
LNKYKGQESRLKEVVNADEELKQQDNEVKERRAKMNSAVEKIIGTDSRLECVCKHNDNTRQRKRRKQHLACGALHDEQTSPKRHRLLDN